MAVIGKTGKCCLSYTEIEKNIIFLRQLRQFVYACTTYHVPVCIPTQRKEKSTFPAGGGMGPSLNACAGSRTGLRRKARR